MYLIENHIWNDWKKNFKNLADNNQKNFFHTLYNMIQLTVIWSTRSWNCFFYFLNSCVINFISQRSKRLRKRKLCSDFFPTNIIPKMNLNNKIGFQIIHMITDKYIVSVNDATLNQIKYYVFKICSQQSSSISYPY